MTASKTNSPKSTTAKAPKQITDTEPKYVGTETLNEDSDNVAQAAFGRAKEAMPSLDDVKTGLRDKTDIDVQSIADDAAMFVRRNPAASVAAAAGVGVLIGILASKRI
jgi:ElaB/YqjD/DUF883 family membrane-anchored ribosome-binding protein